MKIISDSEGFVRVFACFIAVVQGAGFLAVGGAVYAAALVVAWINA